MLKVVWNIFKSIFGIIFSVFRPLRRLICRRRKSSETDELVLTSIGTGTVIGDLPLASYGQDEDGAEIEMESWDSWDAQSPSAAARSQSQQMGQSQFYGHSGDQAMNGFGARPSWNHSYNQMQAEPEPEPEINFFEDMTPDVKRQPKILIRKKESSQAYAPSAMSNRLAVMSDVPFSNSELEAWEDGNNAWDSGEASEDLTWQAEEAIKEKRKQERMERQMEHQKRKQRKEEMRGTKGGSLIATKLS